MTIAWEAAAGSHVGRIREGNEDAVRIDAERGVFLVADGMGGHAAGEVASRLAAEAVATTAATAVDAGARGDGLETALARGFERAWQAIRGCCADDPDTRGMGTTLTACVLSADGELRIAHIGDSRLYRFRAGRLEQLTRDHTWVQREVDSGRLTAVEALRHPHSHILTRVLTDDLAPEVDFLTATAAPADLLLLATDGLYNMLGDESIARRLDTGAPLTARVAALIDAANRAGGADNVSIVLVRILERTPSPT